MSNPFNYSVFERSMLLDLNPRMDTGQREENASKYTSLLIQSEAKLQNLMFFDGISLRDARA